MQSYAPLRLALLAIVAALSPTTVDRRAAMKLPLAVVALAPGAARADDVIVSGTVNAVDANVGPDAALYVTMRRGGAPQAAFSKFRAVPEPSLAAVRIPLKGKTFPIDFSIPRSALFPDAPALPDEIKDVALTVSARLDQDGVAATRGPDDLVGSVYTTPSSAPAAIALEPRGVVSKFMK
jgi:hypothetical protein